MWILILTIASGYVNAGPTAMTAVPGFTSVATCEAAASRWLSANPTSRSDVRYVSAICVKA